MREAEVVVRVPLPIINDVAAELLHHLLETATHVPVGVGLCLEAEVGGVLATGRVRRVGDGLRGNQSSTCASIRGLLGSERGVTLSMLKSVSLGDRVRVWAENMRDAGTGLGDLVFRLLLVLFELPS